jgi:hypothetical protein
MHAVSILKFIRHENLFDIAFGSKHQDVASLFGEALHVSKDRHVRILKYEDIQITTDNNLIISITLRFHGNRNLNFGLNFNITEWPFLEAPTEHEFCDYLRSHQVGFSDIESLGFKNQKTLRLGKNRVQATFLDGHLLKLTCSNFF